jgi:hypothetical protein
MKNEAREKSFGVITHYRVNREEQQKVVIYWQTEVYI